jgi:hypothetical protein
MARKIAAISFVILILAVSITGKAIIDSKINSLLNDLEKIEKLAMDGDKIAAVDEANKFVEQWDKSEKILSVFITHSEIDNVNIALEQAVSYLNTDENDDFLAKSAELKKLLKHLIDNEKVNLQNIF